MRIGCVVLRSTVESAGVQRIPDVMSSASSQWETALACA